MMARPDRFITVQVLGVLFVALAASSAMFVALVRRWTSHRRETAVDDWARRCGFRREHPDPDDLPAPLQALRPSHPRILCHLSSATTRLLHVETDRPASATERPPSASIPPSPTGHPLPAIGRVTWRLLIRRGPSRAAAAGLRPTEAERSLLDLFSMGSFPLLGSTQRFVVFAEDAGAAAALSESPARALLPPDVGLLAHGERFVLDFSSRPFDELEFDRMTALADQLSQKL